MMLYMGLCTGPAGHPRGTPLGSIGGNSDLPAKERGRSLTARFGGPFSFRHLVPSPLASVPIPGIQHMP